MTVLFSTLLIFLIAFIYFYCQFFAGHELKIAIAVVVVVVVGSKDGTSLALNQIHNWQY